MQLAFLIMLALASREFKKKVCLPLHYKVDFPLGRDNQGVISGVKSVAQVRDIVEGDGLPLFVLNGDRVDGAVVIAKRPLSPIP